MSAHAVPIVKYHGTGNDFLVVDAAARVPDRAAFARAHCDRETGVSAAARLEPTDLDADATVADATVADTTNGRRGADGVLFVSVEPGYTPTRVVMTLVQPDGSTADMCGNGARVVARWAHDRTGDREFMIDTQAGTRRATVSTDGHEATIEMGVPRFDPRAVPVDADAPLVETPVEGLTITAVDTGVPHAVAFLDPDEIGDVTIESVAPPVRHASVFPEGANVNLAAIRETEAGQGPVIDQRTFERGVEGETRSCGTGAVAVVAAARRIGLIDDETAVTHPPGGELTITAPDGERATLTGPVAREYAGRVPAVPR
jgi:diaminopimelate epimerase